MTNPNTQYNSLQELFADKNRWTQHSYARDKNLDSCQYNNRRAACWCLLGGIRLVYGYDIAIGYSQKAKQIMNKIADVISLNGFEITSFNDNSTHEQILSLVRNLNV